MNAVSYTRVSTDGQVEKGVSLENQGERIRSYCRYKGFALVAEIEDAGVSGGINKARGGFIELLDRVEAGGVDVIVLYSLERLSRDMLTFWKDYSTSMMLSFIPWKAKLILALQTDGCRSP